MALFTTLTVAVTPVFAADASWSDNNITYQNRTYAAMAGGGAFHDEGFSSVIPSGSTAYSYHNQDSAHIIYFAPGVDVASAEEARYVTFTYSPDTGGLASAYSNPSNQTPITITPKSTGNASTEQAEGEADDTTPAATSCKVDSGLSWIICPLTNALANGMDWLFDHVLTSFLRVPAVSTNQDSATYRAWGYMRNLANIMFAIGFMIIVYSQSSSIGISNYGIKKLLPRLVVAAILVNLSYYIVALSVDLSNVLGYAFQNMFMVMRESLVIESPKISWSEIAAYVLSGGAIGVGLLAAGHFLLAPMIGAAVGGSIATAFIMLMPVLLGAVLSVIVAIFVLAARQAIITVLIILSPIAFVAYLLPNTEKYFDKWRSLFFTMLMIFPMFSILYGGAQLAGAAIIDNAGSGATGLAMIILGMAVQIIPLAITPFLVRMSGSMIGSMAGFLNSRRAGLVSKTKGLTDEVAAKRKAEWMHDNQHNGYLAKRAKKHDQTKRKRAALTKAYEAAGEEEFKTTEAYQQAHAIKGRSELRGHKGESDANRHFYHSLRHEPGLQQDFLESKLAHDQEEYAKLDSEDFYSSLKTDPASAVAVASIANLPAERRVAIEHIAHEAHANEVQVTALQWRENSNKRVQEGHFRDAIINDEDLRRLAGNSDADPHGAARVLNIAEEGKSKAREEIIASAAATYRRNDAKVEELHQIIHQTMPAGSRFAAHVSLEDRSAALRHFLKIAPETERLNLIAELNISSSATGNTEAETLRSELAGALAENKPFILPNSILQNIAEGGLDPAVFRPGTRDGLMAMVGQTINSYGLGAEAMVGADRDDLKVVAEYIRAGKPISADARAKILENFDVISDKNGLYYGKIQKNRAELNDIRAAMNQAMGLNLPPLP